MLDSRSLRLGPLLDISDKASGINPPLGHFFEKVRDCILANINQKWMNENDCKVYNLTSLRKTKSDIFLNLETKSLKSLIGVITGHFMIGNMRVKWDASVS